MFTRGTTNLEQLKLALVIHNHQPVDNEDEIVEDIYKNCYYPFLKVLSVHSKVKANLHYTGSLLEWLESRHPEFMRLLRTLVNRSQVEIIGGAYYEPIVSVIPDADADRQIDLLSRKIRRSFGKSPSGFWTAERAWEPQLPEVLDRSGLRYTLLDDDIFAGSGIQEPHLFEPYIVESRGSVIEVFPMVKRLRYLIPFQSVPRTISYLRKSAGRGKIAVYADDGEKFGAWPSTFERVYTRGWLESFLRALEKETGWLSTVKLSEYLAENPARNRIYLSSSSYPELMNWSLPVSGTKNAKERGFWRLFLAKYPESARMYARMLRVSRFVHRPGMRLSREIVSELWKGQCNDAYWHGVFGGLYAAPLRRITNGHLIAARALAEKAIHHEGNYLEIEQVEFDRSNDLLVNTKFLGVLATPRYGGTLIELDDKRARLDLFDTLSRRKESYHQEIRKNIRTSSTERQPPRGSGAQ